MCKKALTMFCLVAVTLLASCVDGRYDLANKEIATDVKIEGNQIALPFGDLKSIVLDSILDISEIEILEKNADGVYSIALSDTMAPFETSIDPINIAIDHINHSVEINFTEAEITTVHLEGTCKDDIKFKTPDISLEELNEELPSLNSNVTKGITSVALEQFFEMKENGTWNPALAPATIAFEETVTIDDEEVECKFTYTLPEEVETINSIKLTSASGAGDPAKGTLVQVVVTHPAALLGIDKTMDFRITFPELFLLSEDTDGVYDLTLSADRHEVYVNDLELEGSETLLTFYIAELQDIDKEIVEGMIDVDKPIYYTVVYNAAGDIELNEELGREDFDFNVAFNVPLKFMDVHGSTKELEVEFEPVTMDFAGHFDNLEYIDTIHYVQFNAANSMIRFETLMETEWFSDFSLKDGYALKISFPYNLTFKDELSSYESKGDKIVYDSEKHAFYVYDLEVLGSTHWNLALDRLTLEIPVVDGECDMNVAAKIAFVDENDNEINSLLLAGAELESMKSTLDKLKGEKDADFTMLASDLEIEDASVHTEVIYSELDTHTSLDINEKVPAEIGRIEAIGLDKDVPIKFEFAVRGVENVDADVHLDFRIALPSFLKLEYSPERSSDVNINFEGDTLYLEAECHSRGEEKLSFELLCTGLDFMTEEFDYQGMLPQDSTDGNRYLKYVGDIAVIGDAYVDDMEFHSQLLNQIGDINIDVDVDIDEMQVKMFHGIYDGEIDEVEESLELDLGEGLDFLKDEGTSMTLAEPQIEIVLGNSISVPVDVDMHIFGRDELGEIIPSSEIIQRLSVLPAEYDSTTCEIVPVETKIFLTSDSSRVSKVGYNNVEIPNLARLLEKVPDVIDFKIKPVINTSQTHHVDISQPLSFDASYSVVIPLRFDNFNMCYTDTIAGLQEGLGETLDMFTNVSLGAKMKVLNTVPLGLSLEIQPMDENGDTIKDISIDSISIKGGLGGNIIGCEGQEAQDIAFAIKSKTGDFGALDKLLLNIKAATDHTSGSVGLKGEQGIKISDIVFEIAGDIEVDLRSNSK